LTYNVFIGTLNPTQSTYLTFLEITTSGLSNMTKRPVCITAAHGWFNCIYQVAPMCSQVTHAFLGSSESTTQNGISIGSAIFAQLMAECRQECLGMFFP